MQFDKHCSFNIIIAITNDEVDIAVMGPRKSEHLKKNLLEIGEAASWLHWLWSLMSKQNTAFC